MKVFEIEIDLSALAKEIAGLEINTEIFMINFILVVAFIFLTITIIQYFKLRNCNAINLAFRLSSTEEQIKKVEKQVKKEYGNFNIKDYLKKETE